MQIVTKTTRWIAREKDAAGFPYSRTIGGAYVLDNVMYVRTYVLQNTEGANVHSNKSWIKMLNPLGVLLTILMPFRIFGIQLDCFSTDVTWRSVTRLRIFIIYWLKHLSILLDKGIGQ